MDRHNIKKFYEIYDRAQQALKDNDFSKAASLLDDAHYLGVFNTMTHVMAHFGKILLLKRQKRLFRLMLEVFFLVVAFFTPITRFCYRIGLFLPMHPVTQQAFNREYQRALDSYHSRNYADALFHIGRAHILGSHFATYHCRTHFLMLKIEIHRFNMRGVAIQSSRLIGALFTRILVHRFGVTGSPGHSEYPIGTRLPIAEDLLQELQKSLSSHAASNTE